MNEVLVDACKSIVHSISLLCAIGLSSRYFYNSIVPKKAIWFVIATMIPLIVPLAFRICHLLLFNNIILPFINDHYPFIDKYCKFWGKMRPLMWHLMRLSLWIFYLCRIKYYFKYTKFNLSNSTFLMHASVYITITLSSLILNYGKFDSYGFEIVTDGDHKYCAPAIENNMAADITFGVVFILNEGVIYIILLYLLYSKTNLLEKEQSANDHLSVFYSQRDDVPVINTKIMRRCIFFSLSSLIVQWTAICVFIKWNKGILFPLSQILSIVDILVSFDGIQIMRCKCFRNMTLKDKENNDNNNNAQNGIIELTESKEMYLNKIMNAYYSEPKRLKQQRLDRE